MTWLKTVVSVCLSWFFANNEFKFTLRYVVFSIGWVDSGRWNVCAWYEMKLRGVSKVVGKVDGYSIGSFCVSTSD